ncbi:MAG: hypothetical protein ACOYBC_05625 [Bilifractor sp.]|jgi:hypothetical protein
MAQYDVTFSCGHTATIQLFGKEADRQRKIKWFEENGLCPECYRAQKEAEKKEQAEADAKEADALGLAELTGSEKQIAWANSIRAEQINTINTLINNVTAWINKIRESGKNEDRIPEAKRMIVFLESMSQVIGSEASARKIIDWRDANISELTIRFNKIDNDISSSKKVPEDFNEYGSLFVEVLKMVYCDNEPKQETTVLSPENKTSDTMVTVTFTENSVSVESPKDYMVIEIVKENGYRWNGNFWNLQIYLQTGKAEDRAAEIANKMLSAGFQVTVPTQIADAAVSGNYEPRCTRWISSYTDDHDHVYVSWGKDDDMYNTVKELSGSKWVRGRGMRIPASSADEIEEFAETYGFRISAGALKQIEAYRDKVEVVVPGEGSKEEKIDKSENIRDIMNSSRDIIEDLKDD